MSYQDDRPEYCSGLRRSGLYVVGTRTEFTFFESGSFALVAWPS